ncbi:MAG: MFS transporter [Dehalococcoidales bacterium]|nr:MFS transporter [Dehalococcoidales bacterium]
MGLKLHFYYGYIIVAASAIIMTMVFGVFYSYTVFFDSLLTDFSWSHAVTSGAFSVGNLIVGLMGIVIGRISDRVGSRIICFFSGISLALGYFLMSRVAFSWQIYLIYGLVLAVGIGGLFPSLLSTIARWFTARRGTMTGIITCGIGIGSIIFPPLLSRFILDYGWRNTYLIVALITLAIMLPMAILIKSRPNNNQIDSSDKLVPGRVAQVGERDLTFRQAVGTRQLWMGAAAFFLFGFSQFAIMVHIVPYATREGISPVSAAGILGVIGAGSIFSRLTTGVAADKIRVKRLFFYISLVNLTAFLWLQIAHQLWALYIFGFIFGMGYGASSTVTSLLAAELFGLRSLASIIGIFACSASLGGATGPILVGYIFDISLSYLWAFVACNLAALIALIIAVTLPLAPDRVRSSSA